MGPMGSMGPWKEGLGGKPFWYNNLMSKVHSLKETIPVNKAELEFFNLVNNSRPSSFVIRVKLYEYV